MIRLFNLFAITVATLLLFTLDPAEAYIGPGAGITAIGTVVALIGAILLAVVGFVWYPLKRLRARNKKVKYTGEGPPKP